MGFPKFGGTFLGVPILRIIVFGVYILVPPTVGDYHIVPSQLDP